MQVLDVIKIQMRADINIDTQSIFVVVNRMLSLESESIQIKVHKETGREWILTLIFHVNALFFMDGFFPSYTFMCALHTDTCRDTTYTHTHTHMHTLV